MEKCLREVEGKKGTIRKYLLLLRIVDNSLGSSIIGNWKIGCKSIFGLWNIIKILCLESWKKKAKKI